MVKNLKIKKYWITTLCMVFCSLASFAQDLSDATIGFDVARLTIALKEHGVKNQDIEAQISMMREAQKRQYLETKKIEDNISQKIKSEQSKKANTGKVALASPEILAQEKAALIALYNSTNGAAWTNTVSNQGAWPVNDPDAVVTRWDNNTKTGWYGVSVSAEGRVTGLNLSYNNLTGYLTNLNALTELTTISFVVNKIQGGNIDSFGELTKLITVNISSCNLDGNLQSLMKSTNLISFSAQLNNISGSFPEDFYKLSKLQLLDVYLNKLEGDYSVLGQIPSLTTLALTGNNFNKTGSADYNNRSIPESFKNLTNLTSLRIQMQGLKNNLKVLGYLINLTSLEIDNNKFEGPLPSEFSALKKLSFFTATLNAITDISVLSSINSLQTIGCQSNSIVSIPPGFSQLSNLSSLNVAKNKLSGPLLDLTSPKLNYLDISENYFRFIDIEPVFSKYSNFAAFSFRYAPQAKTDLAETINRGTGSSVTLSMSDDGVHRYTDNDKFKWYKGVYPNGVLISQDESRQLTISNLKLSDAGNYYALSTHPQITNAAIANRNLILERQPITLKITNCPTVAGNIKAATEKFYTNAESSFTFETTATGLTYEWSVATAAGTSVNAAPSNTNGSYSYTFSEAGDYIVTLIAKDVNGCSTTFTKPIQVINERYCANEPINFGFETTTPGLTYTWNSYDASGTIVHTATNTTGLYTFIPQLGGEYEVELIVNTATSCKTLFTKNITVEDCTPIVSCTVNNPLTQKVHSLFINLITKLVNTPNGTDANVYARNEIIALSSYVAGTTNSIYNFSNSNAAVTFSFSQNGAENDVYIPKSASGAISGIDLSKYFGAQGTTAVTTNYSNGTNGSGAYVRNIDFCPIAECIPITGVINIVKKATAQAKKTGQSSTNSSSKI
ncbi:hypothetical protein GJU43_21755 [Flavobacterium sp. LC2016-23]|uniref:hypothetical protein n=1 Tax=Flavobacterium sp. LC2016-23 TaxID=2666330 RepID=UPI0012B0414F|nr:hypothetical protein [Flavobacterium sp. LC2016-23]MRX41913.1 hypothetical protein [Flavobacterium sp. LC2016-23]